MQNNNTRRLLKSSAILTYFFRNLTGVRLISRVICHFHFIVQGMYSVNPVNYGVDATAIEID